MCVQLTMYEAVVWGYAGHVVRFTQYVNKENLNIKASSQISSTENIVCCIAVQGLVLFHSNTSSILKC